MFQGFQGVDLEPLLQTIGVSGISIGYLLSSITSSAPASHSSMQYHALYGVL